jgi:hypothetical protein
MILGRPTNLWLGLITAILGAAQVIAVVVLKYDAVAVSTVLGAVAGVLGALILLVANQPPTVTPGSDVTVQTPSGQPNATATLGLTREGEVTVRQ